MDELDGVPYPAHHNAPRLIDWVIHQARLAEAKLPEATDYEPLIADALRLFPKHTEDQARLLFMQAWRSLEQRMQPAAMPRQHQRLEDETLH